MIAKISRSVASDISRKQHYHDPVQLPFRLIDLIAIRTELYRSMLFNQGSKRNLRRELNDYLIRGVKVLD